jgi:hypothetical protein
MGGCGGQGPSLPDWERASTRLLSCPRRADERTNPFGAWAWQGRMVGGPSNGDRLPGNRLFSLRRAERRDGVGRRSSRLWKLPRLRRIRGGRVGAAGDSRGWRPIRDDHDELRGLRSDRAGADRRDHGVLRRRSLESIDGDGWLVLGPCHCDVVYDDYRATAARGTYTISGGTLTTAASGGDSEAVASCVQGTTLRIRTVNSSGEPMTIALMKQ